MNKERGLYGILALLLIAAGLFVVNWWPNHNGALILSVSCLWLGVFAAYNCIGPD
jgi:hypothetical protein